MNTKIYQLYHDKMTGRLEKAESFLFLPSYLFANLFSDDTAQPSSFSRITFPLS